MKKSKKKALYEKKLAEQSQNISECDENNDRNLEEFATEQANENIKKEFDRVAAMPEHDGEGHVMEVKTDVDFTKLALAEDELQRLDGDNNSTWWQKLGDKYFDMKKNRQKHLVNRKKYLWLCILTGWFGGHRYYEKRYVLGIIYTLLFWTGLAFVFTIIDWMIAVPIEPDEDGNIWI